MADITISWVRHAESDANILEGVGSMTDFYDFMEKIVNTKNNSNHITEENKYLNNPIDFEEKLLKPIKARELKEYGTKGYRMTIRKAAIDFKESKNYKLFEIIKQVKDKGDEPSPQDYAGWKTEYEIEMEPSKMYEDIKKFNLDAWTENDEYDYKTKLDIKKPPSSWVFTPTITYNGVRQAKLLGREYLNNNLASYDLIICSGTVRTIMTALFSICSSFGDNNAERDTFLKDHKLNIVPYINEKYNGSGDFDRANATVPPVIIDEVVDMIIDYCVDENQNKLLNFPTKEKLKNFIETDPYKKYIKTSGEDLKKYSEGNYEKFLTAFLPSFIEDKKNILAYSHGKNIEEDVKKGSNKIGKAFFPNNCSVWKVHYNKKSGGGSGYERDGTKDIQPDDDNWNKIIDFLKGNYVSRESHPIISDDLKLNIPELELLGFPFPAYFGSFARRTDIDFATEIMNVVQSNNYWGSLDINCLRGKINHLWIKCYVDNVRNTEKPGCSKAKPDAGPDAGPAAGSDAKPAAEPDAGPDAKSFTETQAMFSKNYTITWVRHGEIISQLIEHANDDYPWDIFGIFNQKLSPEQRDYEDKFNKYRIDFIENEIENYMQPQFRDKLASQFSNSEKNTKEMLNEETKTKKKFILSFYDIKHIIDGSKKMDKGAYPKDITTISPWYVNESLSKQISPSTWYFTTTLDSVGILESIQFGKKYLLEKEYDTFICSPTVRTIMTALYALSTAGIKDKEIIIIPYINERNITTTGFEERGNVGIPVEILDTVIEKIKEATEIKDIKINTEYYRKEAKNQSKDYWMGGQFKEKGKKCIENNVIEDNNEKNIMAFVHGNFIKERLSEVEEKSRVTKKIPAMPYNCSAYEIKYTSNKIAGISEKSKYSGPVTRVRDNYDFKDNVEVDENISSLALGNLRGDINDLWINMSPLKTGGGKKRKTKRRGKITKNKKNKRHGKKTKRRRHKKTIKI